MRGIVFMRLRRRHVNYCFMECCFCGYRGNFPDSGECPNCGETN